MPRTESQIVVIKCRKRQLNYYQLKCVPVDARAQMKNCIYDNAAIKVTCRSARALLFFIRKLNTEPIVHVPICVRIIFVFKFQMCLVFSRRIYTFWGGQKNSKKMKFAWNLEIHIFVLTATAFHSSFVLYRLISGMTITRRYEIFTSLHSHATLQLHYPIHFN